MSRLWYECLSSGLFLNGRSEKVAKKKMFDPAVGKVWPPLPEDKEFEGIKLLFSCLGYIYKA